MTITTSTRTRRTIAAAAGATLGAGLLIAAAPAASARIDDREAEGTCSAGSRWNLEVENEHGGLKADFDLDTRASGQAWKLRLKHDGSLVTKTTRSTDYEGELDFQRTLPNHAGTDKVVVKAKNKSTGETCKAVVRF